MKPYAVRKPDTSGDLAQTNEPKRGHREAKSAASLKEDEQNANVGDVLNADEAAKILRIHAVTVRLKAAAGQIPGRKIGNRWRFSRRRLHEWLQAA